MAAEFDRDQEAVAVEDSLVARVHAAFAWSAIVGIAILLNSIALGVIASLDEGDVRVGTYEAIDKLTLAVLILDSVLVIIAKRSRVLRNGWDIFDISVVAVSLFPLLQSFSALRVLRIVRLLRLLTMIPNGRATVDALFRAMRNMGAAMIVMGVVFYIFIIICTTLFRDIDPDRFGDLARSAESLYELMVFFGVDEAVTRRVTSVVPWSWLVFIPFTFLASFTLLNLVIGVFVAAVQDELQHEKAGENAEFLRIERRLDALAKDVEELLKRVH